MNATDVLTSHMRIGTMTNGDVATGSTGTRATGDRLVGVSLGSLAFQVGRLGAGLGWHGSVATHRSTASGESFHLLEARS